eukprot:g32498.t1
MLAPCLLTLASFLLEAGAQMSSSFSRSLRRDGRCIYSFSVAGPAEDACSEPGEALAAVRELRSEREGQQRELAELANRLRLLESWMVRSQGQLSGQQGESLNLLRRLQELEQENRQLRAGHCPQAGRESQQASSWRFEDRGFQELKSEITEIPASSLIQRSDPGGQDTAPHSSGTFRKPWTRAGDPTARGLK